MLVPIKTTRTAVYAAVAVTISLGSNAPKLSPDICTIGYSESSIARTAEDQTANPIAKANTEMHVVTTLAVLPGTYTMMSNGTTSNNPPVTAITNRTEASSATLAAS
jgi:hypothetical protein